MRGTDDTLVRLERVGSEELRTDEHRTVEQPSRPLKI
jgi:hypothetical protein